MSLNVCATSLTANFAAFLNFNFSISFSIGGSGTHIKVKSAKPYHQIPAVAIQKGIIDAPRVKNNPIWIKRRIPPPR